MGQEVHISSRESFSADIPLYGSIRNIAGDCWNSPAFEVNGEYFEDQFISGRVKGHITVRNYHFDLSENKLTLEGRKVNIEKANYRGPRSTYLWQPKVTSCLDKIQEVYSGPAHYYKPMNKQQNSQVLVRHSGKGITFALDITKKETLCQREVFKTQVTSMYVIISKDNFINGVEKTRKVDRLDNLLGYLTYNYITRAHSFNVAVRELATKSCENSREIVKNKLKILKDHPNSAVLDLFGKGMGAKTSTS